MALESGTYINSLNASNPASTDGLGQADDHLRLIKSTVKATFPNVTGEITADHLELSLLDGATPATSTSVDATDQVILNDGGTMKQVLVSDLASAVNASAGSGSVTSVGITEGSYIEVSGSPITTSGNITVGIASGYMLPTAADMYDFNQAYSWGNHALAGYLTNASVAGFLPTSKAFGIGQTYQNASISANTWYQNSSAKPQFWNVSQNVGGGRVGLNTSTSMTGVVYVDMRDGDSGEWTPKNFIVPPSWYFFIENTASIRSAVKLA